MNEPRPPDRWPQVKPLLDAALDIPPEQRDAFLDDACAGDAGLRAEVERLLRACAESEHFLAEPAVEFAAPILASLAVEFRPVVPGSRIGPYRILEEAGRGGMAVVYLAERDDGQFRMRVALKLVGGGLVAEDELLRRFREERQILAELDHPGIARLLDGGVTEEGLPWFAMEYVEGTPIGRYCDERRLPIEARLVLFGAVCEAVQHAHHKRIVHRDLKPGNILVVPPAPAEAGDPDAGEAGEGQVKLLDFGIAKLLAPEGAGEGTEPTAPGRRLMTPEYASPEQVRGEAVTPAADVYALGVLLYRLVSGRHPYPLGGRHAAGIERRVRDMPPPSAAIAGTGAAGVDDPGQPPAEAVAAARSTSPERLRRRLRGDLDAIVLKALSQEPGHRYPNAGDLAAEVRRHLQGLRVGARREVRLRRAWARARRGWGAATVASVLALVVIPGYLENARPAGPRLDPQRVGVAPFEDFTDQAGLDQVGRMAADIIIGGLAHTGLVPVVPFTATLTASRYVADAPGGLNTAGQIRLFAEETGAGIIVSGRFYQQGDSLYFQAMVTDVVAGSILHALGPIAASLDRPQDGIAELRSRLMGLLAQRFNPQTAHQVAGGLVAPPTHEAYSAHAQGMVLFTSGNWAAAVPRFMEAAAYDSTQTVPLLYAGIALYNMLNHAATDSILALVRPRLHLLGEFEQLGFTMLDASVRGDHRAYYQAHRLAPQIAPGTLAHWGLAHGAFLVNRPREAVRVSRQLDPERGELRGWFGYWADLTSAYHLLGEHRQELRAVRRAQELIPDDPGTLQLEVSALAALGRTRALRTLLVERAEDVQSPALLLRHAGLELIAHGSRSEGEALLRQSLGWDLARPEESPVYRRRLAHSYSLVGELADAERLLRQLAAEQPDNRSVQGGLGILAARRGDVAEARRISQWLAELDLPYMHGGNTYWRAQIASLLGEAEDAVDLLRQAWRQGFPGIWPLAHREPNFTPIRNHSSFREFMRPKG